MTQIQLYMSVIQKLVGLQHFESLLRSYIPVKYLSGTQMGLDLQELDSKLSEAELAALNLLTNYFNSRSSSSNEQPGEN